MVMIDIPSTPFFFFLPSLFPPPAEHEGSGRKRDILPFFPFLAFSSSPPSSFPGGAPLKDARINEELSDADPRRLLPFSLLFLSPPSLPSSSSPRWYGSDKGRRGRRLRLFFAQLFFFFFFPSPCFHEGTWIEMNITFPNIFFFSPFPLPPFFRPSFPFPFERAKAAPHFFSFLVSPPPLVLSFPLLFPFFLFSAAELGGAGRPRWNGKMQFSLFSFFLFPPPQKPLLPFSLFLLFFY